MKHLLLITLASFFCFNALADCRDALERSLKRQTARDSQVNQNLIATGVVSFIIVGVGAAPVAVILGGVVATGSGIHYAEKSNLKGLLKAVNEAYAFYETGVAGDKLLRLKRKINRKLDSKLSTEEIVHAIMSANENEFLCRAKNMNQFARRIEVDLQ
jgi:hypothetical protein